MKAVTVAKWEELEDRRPAYALVSNVDLVVIRWDEHVSVMYGRCLHRGALLSDGFVRGDDLICGLHEWDYRIQTGISAYNNEEVLAQFKSWISDGVVYVDADEIAEWERKNPQPYDRDTYLGAYQDVHGTPEEPHNSAIQELARHGLERLGHHGQTGAMGVSRLDLPSWDDLQFVTAQIAQRPLLDEDPVSTELILGPQASKPLHFDIPLFVSDMSFGSLSGEAKIALAIGAEGAGTGICSGEGGMMPEEQAENNRYLYELASGGFGFSWEKLKRVQAFHYKGGQGAKTGTGGHLPGHKVTPEIAAVRGLEPGQAAISPATFPNLKTIQDFREHAARVREVTGGVPIGLKISAQRIEADLDAALEIGVDYVILDGRGGGTGAAPLLFRDNISVPTIPALARARHHLDRSDASHVTLIITGGLRTPADFCKALALGADGVAVANSALQAIGCLGMRACNSNNCPVGIATQRKDLRARFIVEESAARLTRYFGATTELMKILARACGHSHISGFCPDDLTTFDQNMANLTGVAYGGLAGWK